MNNSTLSAPGLGQTPVETIVIKRDRGRFFVQPDCANGLPGFLDSPTEVRFVFMGFGF
jgi:hypothetical protein